ncbi:MAG: hypothetical protein M3P51_02620 [Chloroflexota bacterium]|nr:hypothetical protein [Chloroflexota bacterium]
MAPYTGGRPAVLNLTNPHTLKRYGIDPDVLTGDQRSDLVACRAIARNAILSGSYCAILAPSASRAGSRNLMIYVAQTSGIRRLSDGPDRITITPGFRWPPHRPRHPLPPSGVEHRLAKR